MANIFHIMYRKVKRFFNKFEFRVAGVGHPIEKKVLFESFRGKTYADNPRAVSEALHNIAPDIKIVWVLNEEDSYGLVPNYVKTVVRNSRHYRKEFTTAAAFVTNEALESYFIKKKGRQLFIQTWHGDRAFKKILYDVWTDRKRPEPLVDDLLTDFCVAGSSYGEHQYRSAFHYKGEVLMEGTPRDDCLYNRDVSRAEEIKFRLNFDSKKRYLLYAPTMRKENQSKKTAQPIQNIDLKRTLNACELVYGGEWICLLRAHPIITGLSGIMADGKKIIDVSDYPDMTDLLLISDCLVTDYSSCAGDYALLGRPLFLFQDDIELYKAKDREFYFDMEDSPYLIANSQTELEDIIKNTSLEKAEKVCENILSFYKTVETGHAAEIVANRIVDFISKV